MLEYYQVCSNDDPGLTLTYCTGRSNLVPYAFLWEKGKTMDFSETTVQFAGSFEGTRILRKKLIPLQSILQVVCEEYARDTQVSRMRVSRVT